MVWLVCVLELGSKRESGEMVKTIVLGGVEQELYDGHVCALVTLAELLQLSFGIFILPSDGTLRRQRKTYHN